MQLPERIAFGLDGLLSDIDLQVYKWKQLNLLPEANPFTSTQYLKDEYFWATMPAFSDIDKLKQIAANNECYILTERPKKIAAVTHSWLRRNFLPELKPDHIIYSSIKRYDCRLLNITTHIDIQFTNKDWYCYDNINPIEWIRNGHI